MPDTAIDRTPRPLPGILNVYGSPRRWSSEVIDLSLLTGEPEQRTRAFFEEVLDEARREVRDNGRLNIPAVVMEAIERRRDEGHPMVPDERGAENAPVRVYIADAWRNAILSHIGEAINMRRERDWGGFDIWVSEGHRTYRDVLKAVETALEYLRTGEHNPPPELYR